ncbi:Zinc finger CCCH domain-containing 15 [Sigmodon hispidus]
MPPKKQTQAGASKKAEQKKKEKIIEDKTFGLKNKKGAKQQKFIKAVTHQVKFGQQNPRQVAQSAVERKLKKDDKKKELQELNELFKPVVAAQKISKGADPKSVVYTFFKQGQCTKGDKRKFSHDLTLERKCDKRSVYIDARDEELEKDTMDNWDEKKLEEVGNKKHGPNVSKITLESFLAWKKRKRQEKIDKLEQDMERRKADFKAGKALVISGREVFEFCPELVNDDDEEADDTRYIQGTGGDEVDDSVGVNDIDAENGERSDLDEDNGGGGQENGSIDAVPVDENLFTGEDLDELEEELNTLDLEE